MNTAARITPEKTEALIRAHDIGVRRDGQWLLQRIELEIHPGELVTLIGPNGAGKTTLARVLLGIMQADKGAVTRKAGLTIGYVPQTIPISPYLPLSVRRFMSLAAECNENDLREALGEVDAVGLLDKQIRQLSGGEWQRVLLARAILRKPDLLILDEPLRGMDINGQTIFYERLLHIRKVINCGILLISHDLHLVMAATDRVVCINRHVCCAGEPEHVTQEPSFTELFGEKAAKMIALYSHHHDHTHGWNDHDTS